MRIIGAARPVAGVFQLDEFRAHLRTGERRARFLSMSSDRQREGGDDGKDEMTSIHGNAPVGLWRLKRVAGCIVGKRDEKLNDMNYTCAVTGSY
jgi:hypothetical protein